MWCMFIYNSFISTFYEYRIIFLIIIQSDMKTGILICVILLIGSVSSDKQKVSQEMVRRIQYTSYADINTDCIPHIVLI